MTYQKEFMPTVTEPAPSFVTVKPSVTSKDIVLTLVTVNELSESLTVMLAEPPPPVAIVTCPCPLSVKVPLETLM